MMLGDLWAKGQLQQLLEPNPLLSGFSGGTNYKVDMNTGAQYEKRNLSIVQLVIGVSRNRRIFSDQVVQLMRYAEKLEAIQKTEFRPIMYHGWDFGTAAAVRQSLTNADYINKAYAENRVVGRSGATLKSLDDIV